MITVQSEEGSGVDLAFKQCLQLSFLTFILSFSLIMARASSCTNFSLRLSGLLVLPELDRPTSP